MNQPRSTASVSKYLLKDAPAPIQESYQDVVSDRSPASRHRKLCQLGEVSLALLASRALSDYRSRHWRDPNEKVEEALARIRRFSLGHYTELLRLTRAEENPFVPPFENGEMELPACNRFAAASSGIEDAVEMEAQNIGRAVEKRLSGSFKKLDWLDFWDLFVAYRNHSEGHSVSHRWPVDHPDYYEIMTERLEAAITEALTQENVVQLFQEYPIATLENIQYENGSYVHQFAGEREGGIPFWAAITTNESVTDRWPADGWQATTERSYILRRNEEGNHEIRALFTDLLTEEKPEPLEKQEPEREEVPRKEKKGEDQEEEAAEQPKRRSPLCGRESEMQRAEAVLDRVGASAKNNTGSGHVVMVAGAGGVGKTLLAKEISQRASERGYEVADIACEPFHEGMSLFPMREIIRQLSGNNSLFDEVAASFGEDSYQASMAELADDATADPARRRDALVATFANVIYGRFASEADQSDESEEAQPILVLFDDLEHIDVGTADALICLLARLSEGAVVIVGAYRSDLIQKAEAEGRRHPLQSVISAVQRRDESFLRLDLDPLGRGAMQEATEAILGGPCKLPRRFYTRLYNETEGNPLFMREILRTLSKESAGSTSAKLQEQDGAWTLTGKIEQWEIPQTVEQAISARLKNLDDQQRTELEKAAIIGRRFAFSVMSELSRTSEDELLDYLESFLSFDIIHEIEEGDEMFEFVHGKIRDVLYQNMSGIRRRRVHSSVADVLMRTQPSTQQNWDALIGEHLYQARRREEACPRLLKAARASMDAYAMTEASVQFRKAVECGEKAGFPSGEDPQDVRMEQALSLKLASEHAAALEIFNGLTDDTTDPSRQGWALNHVADIHQMNGNTTEALKAYARCEEIARRRDDEALLLEVAADLHELHDRWAERLVGLDADKAQKHREASQQYLDEQAELAETSEDTAAKSRAFRNVAKRHRKTEEYEEALENYERGIELSDPRVATHKVQIPYAKTLRYVDRHQEALGVVERVLDWSLQTGARRSEGIARQYHALLLMETTEEGDLRKAHEELTAALAIHREVGFDRGEHETVTLLGEWHLYEENDWSMALDYFHQAIDDDAPSPAETVEVIVAQLHAIGEDHRAERLEAAGPPPDDLDAPGDEPA